MAASVVAVALLSVPALGADRGLPQSQKARFVPGEVLVRFERSATPADRGRVRRLNRVRIAESLWTKRWQRLELPSGVSVAEAVAELRRRPEVSHAEPNYVFTTQAIPSDPSFPSQWGLRNTGGVVRGVPGIAGADIKAEQAWDLTTGSQEVIVGVVDSGIAFDHPDLVANTRPLGNGQPCTRLPADGPNDRDGHGTHIAGIIGAQANNGIGTAGIAWRVSLLPEKALGDDGSGTSDDIAEAFVCAARRGAKVVNASFGGGGEPLVIGEAISLSPDTLFVAAAGNDHSDRDDWTPLWPCQLTSPNVICVAATNQQGDLAHFSAWGEVSVDIAAPGVDILSPHPARDELFSDDFETDIAGRWVAPEGDVLWQRTSATHGSPSHSIFTPMWREPVPASDSVAEIAQPFSIEGRPDCRVSFWAGLTNLGSMTVQWRTDNWSWGGMAEVPSGTYVENFTGYIPSHYAANTRVRFLVRRDQWAPRDRSVAVDDVRVHCRAVGSPSPSYEFLTGTSMATPHVTGVAALLFSKHPNATPVQVKNAILDGADPVPSLEGKVLSGGRLNALKALTVPLRDDPQVNVGPIRTVAGASPPSDPGGPSNNEGGFGGDGGEAMWAGLSRPVGVEPTPDGGFLIADSANNRVRKVASDGTITTVAGNGVRGSSGDDGPATAAQLSSPSAASPTRDGGFLIADTGNYRIRKVSAAGVITTVAGNGDYYWPPGDGGPATAASLDEPTDVAALPDGGFLIAEYHDDAVRRVSPDGTITTVGGGNESHLYALPSVSPTRDGGFVYTERERVRRVFPNGDVSVVAGNGKAGFSGDHGPATEARLSRPWGVVQAPDGGFLIADVGNHRVRRVSPDGKITTVAGTAIPGFAGDGGPATAARLYWPIDVAVLPNGRFLVADHLNHRIRVVDDYLRDSSPPPPPDDGGVPPPGSGGNATPGSDPSVPGSGRQAGGTNAPVSPTSSAGRASVKIGRAGGSLSYLLRNGIRLTVACPEACTYDAELRISSGVADRLGLRSAQRSRIVGRASGRLSAAGTAKARARIRRRARPALRRAKRLRVALVVEVRNPSGGRLLSSSRTLVFRR